MASRLKLKFTLLGIVFFLINLEVFSNEIDLVLLINQYRTEQGLGRLVLEDNLNYTAQKYAIELVHEGRLSHVDKNDNRILDRYRFCGGTAVEAGEILGTSTDVSHIFEAWKNSPSHNTLMINGKWIRIGSAIVENEGNYVAVVLFSTSLIKTLETQDLDQSVQVSLVCIDNFELHFPPEINVRKIEDATCNSAIYRFFIPSLELPLVIPVSGKIGREFKMTDFLYIR